MTNRSNLPDPDMIFALDTMKLQSEDDEDSKSAFRALLEYEGGRPLIFRFFIDKALEARATENIYTAGAFIT